MKQLLYLGFAFPPGMQAQFPGINPAGHAFETQMVAELRTHFAIRSIGVLPMAGPHLSSRPDPATGVAHELVLVERPPELWHRLRALATLKQQYRAWRAEGWRPDAVLAYNLSPIYNNFLTWLKREPDPPKLVLLLLDSPQLGRDQPWLKRLRYRLKPLLVPDAVMLRVFDAGIGLSQSTAQFFAPRQVPFLWMPGGCLPARATPDNPTQEEATGPLQFGYFGALAPHAGVMPLVETFLASPLVNTLHICGHGKLAETLAALAQRDPRLKFHGLLPLPQDCLRRAQAWDVLINPRPASHGNENNFPSKVFEYALCRRAILSSRLAGVDTVLGPEALYFDPRNFVDELRTKLSAIAGMSRAELRRRGNALYARVTTDYNWARQAARMADFIIGTP